MTRKSFSSQNSIGFINFKIVLIHGRNHGMLRAISFMIKQSVEASQRAMKSSFGGISICNASSISLRMKIMAEAYSALPCHCWLQWLLNFLIVKWRFTSCTPHKVISNRNVQIREIKLVTVRQSIEFGRNKIVIGVMGRNHP